MKKITIKRVAFVFLCLAIITNTYSANFDSPKIKSHQEAVHASIGSQVDLKFEVISDGGFRISDMKTHFKEKSGSRYNELRYSRPYVYVDFFGKEYYYITVHDIQKEDDGNYRIELINRVGSGFESAYIFVYKENN